MKPLSPLARWWLFAPMLLLAAWLCAEPPTSRATVEVFLSSTCPISNGYAPELARLRAEWAPRGIAFRLIYVEPGLTIEQARRHAAEHALAGEIVVDSDRRLARARGARVTPEVALVAPEGGTFYQGRIDDRFRDLGLGYSPPRTSELRDALAALLAGRSPARPRTEAVGCPIE